MGPKTNSKAAAAKEKQDILENDRKQKKAAQDGILYNILITS